MTGTARVGVTSAVFAAMLALVVVRPRRWNEAWWTMLGAAAMLALGLVSPREAIDATLSGKNALLFLLSLLALSLLVGKSGFFDWAAVRCARVAKGNARALYRNTFMLGAVVTAILSLDTTAVILTPIVMALVKRLKRPAAPYVVMCAFVANVGSLVLPISNLTNILFADAFRLTFAAFAARMIAPQIVALMTTYALLRWHFRRELPSRCDDASLPEPASLVPNRAYFLACTSVLIAVLLGYFLAPLAGLEPYTVAFAGCGVLAVAGAVTGCVGIRAVGELSWGVFPFVFGLFIAVRGLENLGIVGASCAWLAAMRPDSPEALLASAAATAIASNVVNNLPAALISRSVLVSSHAHTGTILAALVGTDVGPIVTPFGSLATMLVLAIARRAGEGVQTRRFVVLGLWTAPVIVVATMLALILGPH
ncbi:MAG: ArsB/NhaD family transporter [Polyangiaceae bacterium]|jgi:arsenical pump membrane protein